VLVNNAQDGTDFRRIINELVFMHTGPCIVEISNTLMRPVSLIVVVTVVVKMI